MSGTKRRLAALGDWLNPIVVKELRQAVRGRFVNGMLLFFMFVQLVAFAIYMANAPAGDPLRGHGPALMSGFLGILFFTTLFFVPAFVAFRTGAERSDENMDLLYIAAMRSEKIIAGKFWAGLVITSLFFLSSLPFISLTYFLRGVDMFTVLAMMAIVFLVVATVMQVYLCLAVIVTGRILRIVIALGALVANFMVFAFVTAMLTQSMGRGIGSRLISGDLIGPALQFLILDLFLIGGMFMIASAAIKPPVVNRAFPVRIFFSVCWLLFFCLTMFVDIYKPFIVASLMLGCLGFAVAICERESLSLRVAKSVPKNLFLRVPAFFFFSGAASGLAWSLLMAGLILAAGLYYRGKYMDDEAVVIVLLVLGFAACYALTAHWLYRRFFDKLLKKGMVWVVLLSLLILGTFFPWFVDLMLTGGKQEFLDDFRPWAFTNPFLIANEDFRELLLSILLFWLLIVGGLEFSWFSGQVKAFKPFEPDRPNDVEP